MAGGAAVGLGGVPKLPRCGAQLPAITPQTWGPAERELVPANPTLARVCSEHELNALSFSMARELAREFDAVPAGGIPRSCLGVVPQVVVSFGYASGRVVSVGADLGACALASNGSVSRRAVGRYAHLIYDLALLSGARLPLRPGVIDSHSAPGCSAATASQSELNGVGSATVSIPGSPFGVASSPDAPWSFVALDGLPATSGTPASAIVGRLAVMSDATFAPALVRTIGVSAGGLAGVALSADGRYLIATAQTGATAAYVLSTSRLEDASADPVLGALSIPDEVVDGPIEAVTSRDSRFAFVSIEYSDEIAVFDLRSAIAHDFRTSGFVGTIALGRSVVGMAISPDGKWLYATSDQDGSRPVGALSVISVPRAESDPAHAVRANVTAGCGPVRAAVSPDGQSVWVTARESNALLRFSASLLLRHPAHALTADLRVGQAPVGLALVNNGQQIIVADSNRFMVRGASAQLTIIDTSSAQTGKPAIAGYLPTGLFPREESLEPNGTLLITDFLSRQVQAVDTTHLP